METSHWYVKEFFHSSVPQASVYDFLYAKVYGDSSKVIDLVDRTLNFQAKRHFPVSVSSRIFGILWWLFKTKFLRSSSVVRTLDKNFTGIISYWSFSGFILVICSWFLPAGVYSPLLRCERLRSVHWHFLSGFNCSKTVPDYTNEVVSCA